MTVVPLQNNGRQATPLQKQEPIKPMVTPEEARALSAAAQAKLNNADWVAKYREMSEAVTPKVDPISMQSQMAAALSDPVYGQATATGLAAGEGMLNSWIAGINSRARRDEANLANERWIKAQDDLAKEREENKRRWEAEAAEGKRRFGILQKAAEEDRKLRRDELAESKKQVVQAPGYTLDAFKESAIRSNPKYAEAIDRLNTAQVGKNAEEAARIQNQQRLDKQMLDAAQESLPMKLTSSNSNAIDTERTDGLLNMTRRALNWIPVYRRMALTGDERALANAQAGMEEAGYKSFSSVSPEYLLKEAQKNIDAGNINTGVQQRKVAQLLDVLLKRPGFIAKQSPDGSVVVVSGPNQEAITITPGTIDRYAKEYDLSWR